MKTEAGGESDTNGAGQGELPDGASKRTFVRDLFDRIAPRYDLLNRLISLGLDQRWRRLTVDALDLARGDRVLDLACGTGDLAILAAARGARVVGVDSSRGMLRAAALRSGGSDAKGDVRWLLADAEQLPLPDGWAHCATSGFALRNFPSLTAALREMARVVAPGGRVALVEVDRPRGRTLRAAHSLYFDRLVPRLGAWLSDRDAYRYLPASTAYLPPEPELRRLLEGTGFETPHKRSLLWGAAQLIVTRRSGGDST